MDQCIHCEAIKSKQETFERDRTELWGAVTEIRNDIKGLSWKLGLIVGGISAVNSLIAVLLK